MLGRPELDPLMFHPNSCYVSGGKRPTRRIAPKIIMSLFDFLSFPLPYPIHGRFLNQDLWRSELQRIKQMSDKEFEKWTYCVELLPRINELGIHRCNFGKADSLWLDMAVRCS